MLTIRATKKDKNARGKEFDQLTDQTLGPTIREESRIRHFLDAHEVIECRKGKQVDVNRLLRNRVTLIIRRAKAPQKAFYVVTIFSIVPEPSLVRIVCEVGIVAGEYLLLEFFGNQNILPVTASLSFAESTRNRWSGGSRYDSND